MSQKTKTDSTSGRGLTPHLGCVKTPLLGVSMSSNHLRKKTGSGHANLLNLGFVVGFVFVCAGREGLLQKETKRIYKGEYSSSWSQFMTFHEKSHLFSFHRKIGAVSEVFHKLHLKSGHSIPHLLQLNLIRTECLRRRTHAYNNTY